VASSRVLGTIDERLTHCRISRRAFMHFLDDRRAVQPINHFILYSMREHGETLTLFDLLRYLAKFLGLFVTCLYLQLGELSRFLRQEQNQSLKSSSSVAVSRVVGRLQH
jgi:hypothetical protein